MKLERSVVAFVWVAFAACAPLAEVQVVHSGRTALPRCAIGAQPVDFTQLRIGNQDEAAWLAERTETQRSSHAQDKETFSRVFIETVQGKLPVFGACVMVTSELHKWDLNAPGDRSTAEARLLVRISDTGRPADEIIISADVLKSLSNPSAGGQMKTAAKRLGEQVLDYIRARREQP